MPDTNAPDDGAPIFDAALAAAESSPQAPDAPPDVDRVAMPSLRADGTPDQTPGFELIG